LLALEDQIRKTAALGADAGAAEIYQMIMQQSLRGRVTKDKGETRLSELPPRVSYDIE
jgi:hypothetical protein